MEERSEGWWAEPQPSGDWMVSLTGEPRTKAGVRALDLEEGLGWQ